MVGKVLAKEWGVMMCCRAAVGVAEVMENGMSGRGVHYLELKTWQAGLSSWFLGYLRSFLRIFHRK